MRMLKVQRASAQTPPPGAKQPRLEPQSTQSEVLLSEFKPPPLEAAARHGLDRVRRVESPNLREPVFTRRLFEIFTEQPRREFAG